VALVTLESAKRHCTVTHDLDDALIAEKIEQAEAIIFDYIEREDGFWITGGSPPESPPKVLVAACLMVVAALYENREGYDGGPSLSSYSMPEPLGDSVKNLLRRFRTPAVG